MAERLDSPNWPRRSNRCFGAFMETMDGPLVCFRFAWRQHFRFREQKRNLSSRLPRTGIIEIEAANRINRPRRNPSKDYGNNPLNQEMISLGLGGKFA